MPLSLAVAPIRSAGGFLSGIRYPFKAAVFIIRHPSLWPWCIMPVVINVVLICLIWWWSGTYAAGYLQGGWVAKTGWLWDSLEWAARIGIILLRIGVTLVAFVVVGSFAALPFNDLLSEQTDKLAGNWNDPRPFSPWRMSKELAITGLQEGKRMTFYLMLVGPLIILSFVPMIAPFAVALKVMITALFFSVDYLSYPLERRGALMFRDKWRFTRTVAPITLGFGIAVTALVLIPIVNFMFMPLAVVGGTLLFADLTRIEGERLSAAMPARFNLHGPPNLSAGGSMPPPPPPPANLQA